MCHVPEVQTLVENHLWPMQINNNKLSFCYHRKKRVVYASRLHGELSTDTHLLYITMESVLRVCLLFFTPKLLLVLSLIFFFFLYIQFALDIAQQFNDIFRFKLLFKFYCVETVLLWYLILFFFSLASNEKKTPSKPFPYFIIIIKLQI